MAESQFSEQIVPGTFIRIQAEGLISAGGISAGNIGIVGTAVEGNGALHILSSYEDAKAALGDYDAFAAATLNLVRSIELLYQNGARTVFAYSLPAGADQAAFSAGFAEVVKEDVQIVVAPELATTTAISVLGPVVNSGEDQARDMIAIIGSDDLGNDVADIVAQVSSNKRFVLTAPGIQAYDATGGANVTKT